MRRSPCRSPSGSVKGEDWQADGHDDDDEAQYADSEALALKTPLPAGVDEDLVDLMNFESVFTAPVTDVGEQMPGYLRIKGGITMDTGSAAFVMPTKWLPMFALQPSEGSKRGQRYVGATGNVVQNEGQKAVNFFTREQEGRKLTFQCAPVNKMLACVSGVADAGNGILFLSEGGIILKLDPGTIERIKELISKCTQTTKFDRKGNTYVLEAFVKVPAGSRLEQQVASRKKPEVKKPEGFQRPEN